MLPRRLGARFALEALFLVLLAVGAGLADLRPLYIVLVMAGAWILVALAELTAERMDRSPLSYLLPTPAAAEDEPDEVFGPRPEERTVVAPPLEPEPAPEPAAAPEPDETVEPEEAAEPEQAKAEEPQPEPEQAEADAGAEPVPLPEPEPEQAPPVPATAGAEAALEPSLRRRVRSLLRRREPEPDSAPETPPRHVKLLPRRSAPEPSRASREVAEVFGGEEPDRPEETGT